MHYTTTLLSKEPVIITGVSFKIFNETQVYSQAGDDEKGNLQFLLDFLKDKKNFKIVTWNQKNENYGPLHIISRCKTYELDYECINIDDFVDLDDMLKNKYGKPYLKNPYASKKTKFITLAEKNNIETNDAVEGLLEIIYFYYEDYPLIRNSVARKVKIISEILKYEFEKKLKTEQPIIRRLKKMIINRFFIAIISIISVIIGIITLLK